MDSCMEIVSFTVLYQCTGGNAYTGKTTYTKESRDSSMPDYVKICKVLGVLMFALIKEKKEQDSKKRYRKVWQIACILILELILEIKEECKTAQNETQGQKMNGLG